MAERSIPPAATCGTSWHTLPSSRAESQSGLKWKDRASRAYGRSKSFIHALMPLDRAQSLTPQQAFDVATYIDTRPRPDFPPKVHDWPRGGKPNDADYHVLPIPPQEKSR
jgi:hypothetical protein